MERALRAQGIRAKLEDGKKRYPFQTDHGFRKFFKTRCEMAGMRSINIEMLMNHSTGVSDSYYRPQESEVMQDYLKAVEHLTIIENAANNHIFKKEIDELREENVNNKYILKTKLQGKDDALVTLSDQVMRLMREVQNMKNGNIH